MGNRVRMRRKLIENVQINTMHVICSSSLAAVTQTLSILCHLFLANKHGIVNVYDAQIK